MSKIKFFRGVFSTYRALTKPDLYGIFILYNYIEYNYNCIVSF